MREKLKNRNSENIIRTAILVILSMRMFCHLFYTTEQEFQIYKDIELFKALIIFMLVLAIYRGISIKDWIAGIFVLASVMALLLYFKINNINAETYGPTFFEYTIYRGILQLLFIGLMADLIRHKPYRWDRYLKNPIVIFYFIFIIVFFVTDVESVIPYVCPAIALVLTRFDNKQRQEITYIFSGAMYYAFARIFTTSLIQNPQRYIGGRYFGSFVNIGSAGAFSACALVACIYIFILFMYKQNYIGMVVCFALAIYPCIAIAMMQSRSVFLGLIFLIGGIFVCVHKKGLEFNVVRCVILVCILILAPISMFGVAKILYYLTDVGKLDVSKLDYFWGHIRAMVAATEMEDSIFEPGTFGFSLDALTSTRFSIWIEKFTYIRLTGFNDYARNAYNSHNFFIANLVRYGYLGGIPFLGWYFACIFKATKEIKDNTYAIFTLFYFLLMLGVYSTLSLYITCMGGFMLLVTQAFCIDNDEDSKIQSC